VSDSEQQRVALVFMAHPDDAEFGCAGTVAAWVREGWEVSYVICTDASGGGPDDATDVGPEARARITATRKAEQRAAGDVLGLRDVVFLDYPDGRIQPTLELRRDIVRLVRGYRPQRVILPSPERIWTPAYPIGRFHPDHLAVGEATLAALYPAAQNPWDFPELLAEGLLPHKVREFYITAAPVLNHAVDISATIELKIDALRAHVSQLGADISELAERVRNWTAEAGKAHGFAHAEVFHKAEQMG
jgi:LmbE family N-acetylglucosaminyl deacetylase